MSLPLDPGGPGGPSIIAVGKSPPPIPPIPMPIDAVDICAPRSPYFDSVR